MWQKANIVCEALNTPYMNECLNGIYFFPRNLLVPVLSNFDNVASTYTKNLSKLYVQVYLM